MKRAWTWPLIAGFIALQMVSLVLMIVGIPLIAMLVIAKLWHVDAAGRYHWPPAYWLYDNQVDGICATWYCSPITRWKAFTWSAFRNSVGNLKFVRGVSDVSRPLYRKTWGARPGGFYVSAGWDDSGSMVLSGGRNVNPY